MEKIKIHTREYLFVNHIGEIENVAIPIANEIIADYSALEIGPCNKPDLYDIVYNNCKETMKKYLASVENDIKKSGIKNPSVKRMMKSEAEEEISILRNKYSSKYSNYNYLRWISIVDGVAMLTDAEKDEIRDSYTIYVKSDDGHKALELANKAKDSLNEYINFLKSKSNRIPFTFNANHTINTLLQYDDVNGQFIIGEKDFDFMVTP